MPIGQKLANIDHFVNINMDKKVKRRRLGDNQNSQLLTEEYLVELIDPNQHCIYYTIYYTILYIQSSSLWCYAGL